MKPVRFGLEAESELAEIALWYESRKPGLAADFLDEGDRILPLISKGPLSFPRLLDIPQDLQIRRALLPLSAVCAELVRLPDGAHQSSSATD